MQITINDIANEAGVSTATVSRVMNNNPKVTEETRKRVLAVMKKYNYSPSFIARGLKNKSMKTIAVVVKGMTTLHHMRIATEINSHFTELGYDVVIFETGTTAEGIAQFLKRMADRSIDGIIFVGSAFQTLEDIPDFQEILKNIPVVISNGWIEGTYGVLVDEAVGARKLMEHIFEIGRKHPVFLSYSSTLSSQNKIQGYKEVMAAHGLEGEVITIEDGPSVDPDAPSFKALVAEGSDIDTIICEDDEFAAKVQKALLKLGVRIPEDIAMGSFNNSIYAELTPSSLTTVDNKAAEQGQLCADILKHLLQDQTEGLEEKKIIDILQPTLVIRESTIGSGK